MAIHKWGHGTLNGTHFFGGEIKLHAKMLLVVFEEFAFL